MAVRFNYSNIATHHTKNFKKSPNKFIHYELTLLTYDIFYQLMTDSFTAFTVKFD